MIWLAVGGGVVGLVGVAFGGRCYWELWKWARQCQGARITVAYKRKVKLDAPLLEWLLWVNMLDKDKDTHGRVVYTVGGTTIAIRKQVKPPRKGLRHVWRTIRKPKVKRGPGGVPAVREGSWKVASDETKVAQ